MIHAYQLVVAGALCVGAGPGGDPGLSRGRRPQCAGLRRDACRRPVADGERAASSATTPSSTSSTSSSSSSTPWSASRPRCSAPPTSATRSSTGRLSRRLRAVLSRHVPGDDGLDERRPDRQQHRRDVGRAGAGDADHRGDGRALSHAAGDRGGMEVLHPGERRHIARLLRHHPDLSRGPAGAGRGCAGDDLEPAAGARPRRWTRRSSTSPSSSC